jgi:hypothetical protein
MTARSDIAGQRFGSLLALSFFSIENQSSVWLFACDCGAFIKRPAKYAKIAVKRGQATSCGCVALEVKAENGRRNRTHGFSKTKLYDVHRQMLYRCYNEACKDFPAYGGRGIGICDEWHDIATFVAWCESSGYADGLTIERQDVNGNYEPGNCTWVVNERQSLNRRHHVRLTVDGVTRPVFEWAAMFGIRRNTIIGRLKHGWSHKDAVSTPAYARRPA